MSPPGRSGSSDQLSWRPSTHVQMAPNARAVRPAVQTPQEKPDLPLVAAAAGAYGGICPAWGLGASWGRGTCPQGVVGRSFLKAQKSLRNVMLGGNRNCQFVYNFFLFRYNLHVTLYKLKPGNAHQTTMSFHPTCVTVAVIKKTRDSVSEDVETGPSCPVAGGMLARPLRKSVEAP